MGLIERIKSALGLGASTSTSRSAPSGADGPSPGDDASPGGSTGTGDAADRASDDGVDVTVEHEPATATEDAVKGTDTAADSEPTAEVDSSTDTESTSETVETDDTEPDVTEDEGEAEDEATGAPTEPAPDAELEDIKGIGPTYAERLREAGVGGVGELAEADAEALAEETDIATSRVEDWVEQAKLY
ncbi:helix-hairpin-helix domain-containing protein [Halosimplex salinum]|uniref:helix-hairpin-helix domain-containing protein n=1 Tax=Halosimplex salinum TaxID=1710538 RepID=UPI000F4AB0F3|nr:helix-hairpin-helix domain-containing protein [Halosimplex salinum]